MGYRSQSYHRFPLHFNILDSAKTQDSLKQIRTSSACAVEKEENENVLGVGVVLAGNHLDALFIKIKYIVRSLYAHKDVITDLLVLFTVVALFCDKIASGNNFLQSVILTAHNMTIVEWISLFVAVLTFSFTGIEVKKSFQNQQKKYRRNYFFVKSSKNTHNVIVSRCIERAMNNAKCKKANPIFTLMFQFYYFSQNQDHK